MVSSGRYTKDGVRRGTSPLLTGLVAIFILVFNWIGAGGAYAGDVVVVQAEGTAVKGEEAKDAKKSALDLALKNAVMEALTIINSPDITSADPIVVEAEITGNPLRFVLNYRILSEGWVSGDSVGEEGEEGHASIEPNPLMVEGGDGKSWEDPWATPEQIYHIRIEASVDTLQLRSAVSRVLSREEGISPITIVLLDAVEYPLYRSFGDTLGRIPMIKDVSYKSFYRGRIVLQVKASGSAMDLKQKLAREIGHNFAIQFGGPQTLTVRAVGVQTR